MRETWRHMSDVEYWKDQEYSKYVWKDTISSGYRIYTDLRMS